MNYLLLLFAVLSTLSTRLDASINHQLSIWKEATNSQFLESLTPDFLRSETSRKDSIETSSRAVVQVRTCNLHFDWIHPYRAPAQSYACGTAFFINEEGHLITNAHVIQNSYFTQILIPGCDEYFEIEVKGMSPRTDVALLKLKDIENVLKKLDVIPFLLLGDSDKVELAEDVTVIGYPLGCNEVRCTGGGAAGVSYEGMQSLFHITANINPGNSGGPVIDNNGHVIGIVVSKRNGTELIGYAIPINNAKNIINFLQHTALYETPRLYIKGNYGSKELCESLKNPDVDGLFISQIAEISPLYKSGVKAKDLLHAFIHDEIVYMIDRFGKVKVSWSKDPVPLFEVYQRFPHNEPIKYIVYRNGKRISGEVTITNQEESMIKEEYPLFKKVGHEVFGGLVMMNLAKNHIPYFYSKKNASSHPWIFECADINNAMSGRIIITDILGGSPAFEARTLSPGSIIRKINGIDVQTLDDVEAAIKLSKGKKFVTIEEYYSGFLIALSVEKICATEEKLAKQYGFSVSSLIEYLS
ncbi:trypsin-like peptidase domain-containing protein [Candidatus Babeliales bacterium]|nr:trypsin-like peptidase domain-containing protein [Candidatus Babeliales bacterium]